VKKNTRQKLQIIGLMSGTSLDGLDIAYSSFEFLGEHVAFEVFQTKTVAYPKKLETILRHVKKLSGEELCLLDKQIGLFFAEQVNNFIKEFKLNTSEIDAIASHGHTVFHQPDKGFTLQIGCGSTISLKTGIVVINDFRTKDVLLGGQGAPLVPIGDFDLFSNEADGFLNLGGFSNISLKQNGLITAFDICPCNLPLNRFAEMKGFSFDLDGNLAKRGNINTRQLNIWDNLSFYAQPAPKSLGTEWLDDNFYAQVDTSLTCEDALRTCVEHIVNQISSQFTKYCLKRVLVTGGGAKNNFLMARLKQVSKTMLIVPQKTIIDFKEAIIFAYLGALYLNGKPNNVPNVTGAKSPVCGGVLHTPK